MKKIPILLLVNKKAYLLPLVLNRLIKYTDWEKFELWILANYPSENVMKIIEAYKTKFPFINIFLQEFNQISVIINKVIKKLKRDFYIKLDDDILVTKNWANAFVNVLNRNIKDIAIGSVVIPVNGFGWKIFLETMDLVNDFKKRFPSIEIFQGCTEPAIWSNPEVAAYIWENSLDIDKTTNLFLEKQKGNFQDLIVPYRYSIGAIIFTHNFWEKIGGWKVSPKFYKRKKIYDKLIMINNYVAKLRGVKEQNRTKKIIDFITKINIPDLGVDEQHIFDYSQKTNLKQIVTTESIVFHFSFFVSESLIVKKFLIDIWEKNFIIDV